MFGDFISPVVFYVIFDPVKDSFLRVALSLVFLREFCVEVSGVVLLFLGWVLLCGAVSVEAVFLVGHAFF